MQTQKAKGYVKLCACKCGGVIAPTKRGNGVRRKGEYARFISGHQSRVKPKSGSRGWHEPWYYEQRKQSI